MKRGLLLGLVFLFFLGLCGCSQKEPEVKKVKDLDFTVTEKEELPEDLKKAIDDKNGKQFKLTFATEEYLYIAVGYGEKSTGGYSVQVNDLFLSDNAIYFDTDLMGPMQDEIVEKAKSCPFIVVKTEFIDKSVIFQ